MTWIFSILLFLLGHLFMSLMFYLNHRFVFHGNFSSRNQLLAKWRNIHKKHHRDYFLVTDTREKLGLLPISGWFLFFLLIIPVLFINIAFAIGMYSYVMVYEVSHTTAHQTPRIEPWTRYHDHHHKSNSNKNFATPYIFWDFLFRSSEKPPKANT